MFMMLLSTLSVMVYDSLQTLELVPELESNLRGTVIGRGTQLVSFDRSDN